MPENTSATTVDSRPAAAGWLEKVPDGQQRIVVGLDGSEASLSALVFAAREAQLRGGILHLVTAYDVSSMAYGYAGGLNITFDAPGVDDGLRRHAEASLKDAADRIATLVPGAPVHVRTTVAKGRASQVLLDAAHGATLLVLGTGGEGALTRLVFGSTSTEVVHHARLPVTVVPADEDGPNAS